VDLITGLSSRRDPGWWPSHQSTIRREKEKDDGI
jgi:hypothetical protein